MSLYGIGTDIVDVARIQRSFERHGERFRQRVFTANEINYCERLAEPAKFRSYAARFAAKEAISKALRTGIGPAFDWVDLEILRAEPSGAPSVHCHGRAIAFLDQERIATIHISLSHSDSQAIAYAIAELA